MRTAPPQWMSGVRVNVAETSGILRDTEVSPGRLGDAGDLAGGLEVEGSYVVTSAAKASGGR